MFLFSLLSIHLKFQGESLEKIYFEKQSDLEKPKGIKFRFN